MAPRLAAARFAAPAGGHGALPQSAATKGCTPSGPPHDSRGWVVAALLILATLPALAAAWSSLRGFAVVLSLPFELDYGEGVLLVHVRELAAGRPLYGDPNAPPYLLATYPPLCHLLLALASRPAPSLLVARWLSVVATLVTAVVVSSLGLALGSTGTGRWSSRLRTGLAAVLAAAIFLAAWPVRVWAPLAHVDALGLALSLVGTLCYLRSFPRWRGCLAGVGLWVGAAFVKQSFLLGAVACLVATGLVDRRRFAIWAGSWAALGATGVALLQLGSGGGFWRAVTAVGGNRFSWSEAWMNWRLLLGSHGLLFVVALCGVVQLLRGAASGPRRRLVAWAMAIYAPLTLLSGIGIGVEGANMNYFLEPLAVLSALVVPALSPAERRSPVLGGVAVAIAVLALVGPTIWPPLRSSTAVMDYASGAAQVAEPSVRAAFESARQEVAAATGEVLSDDLTLLVQADSAAIFQPYIFLRLAERGTWDEGPLVARIKRRELALVVIRGGRGYYSAAMREAIAAEYSRCRLVGPYRLCRPG